jgi:hypothetical protein
VDEIHQMATSKRGAHLLLSLERLEALRLAAGAPKGLQRVGLSATQRPLEEIARLLGGARIKGKRALPRPVEIVDASAKKALSITVEVPPPLPAAPAGARGDDESDETKSIWPQVHARLVERVRAARSTMIFVNSRRLAERLATALMSINAVKGVEIGAGFGSVTQKGSEHRDEITPEGFLGNNAGGILGGISSGQDIVASIALKPTSSIRIPGKSITIDGQAEEVVTTGRHDPCVGIRATPIAEAMLALVLIDHLLRDRGQTGIKRTPGTRPL